MHTIQVKTILNKTKRRDSWFLDEYTINPFSACSFNCLYCYIRGSKYGEHMEQKLSVKENALEVLEKQLAARAKRKQQGIVVLSSATDAYLPVEENLQLTRKILERLLHYQFPVHIITKSPLVLRDLDILREINATAILPLDLQPILRHKVFITFSLSTVEDSVAKIFEPGAPPPTARLLAMKQIAEQGFHTGVSLMPLLPYISDTTVQLEKAFQLIKGSGAQYVFPAGITLFGAGHADSRTLVFRAVEKYFPELKEKYQRLFPVGSTQLPPYYSQAFYKKMKAMCKEYELKDRLY